MRSTILRCALLLSVLLAATAHAGDHPNDRFRWRGHPFVFVLMTDDGTRCNLGWAEVARELKFRFTIAVNESRTTPQSLTPAEMRQLAHDGFEIANHGYSHGFAGVPAACPTPPRGSLLAYFECQGLDPAVAAADLQREIDRDRLVAYAGLKKKAVLTLAYPRHLHSRALVDSLIAEGYIGARFGANESYRVYGNHEFALPASNTWDGGISLFRVPVAQYTNRLFGDHSAQPPVHFTYEQFVAAAQPLIDRAVADGGIFVVYAHHFGDDDDTWGDINYGSAGLTPTDLTWLVELVRANDGAIMTFGEAVTHYRNRSTVVEVAGDYVWVPKGGRRGLTAGAADSDLTIAPNPFNPATTLQYVVSEPGIVMLAIHDARGRLVSRLHAGWRDAGVWSLTWDGRGADGSQVPSGVYVARLVTAAGTTNRKLTLLK